MGSPAGRPASASAAAARPSRHESVNRPSPSAVASPGQGASASRGTSAAALTGKFGATHEPRTSRTPDAPAKRPRENAAAPTPIGATIPYAVTTTSYRPSTVRPSARRSGGARAQEADDVLQRQIGHGGTGHLTPRPEQLAEVDLRVEQLLELAADIEEIDRLRAEITDERRVRVDDAGARIQDGANGLGDLREQFLIPRHATH